MKFTIPYCYPLARGIRANDVNSLVADGPGFTVYLTVGRRYEECRRLEAAVPCASSCLVGKGRVIRPSPLWFNANLVIDGDKLGGKCRSTFGGDKQEWDFNGNREKKDADEKKKSG